MNTKQAQQEIEKVTAEILECVPQSYQQITRLNVELIRAYQSVISAERTLANIEKVMK